VLVVFPAPTFFDEMLMRATSCVNGRPTCTAHSQMESSMTEARPYRLVRERDLPVYAGLRRTQIAELIRRGEFPRPIKLSDGGRAKAWLEEELNLATSTTCIPRCRPKPRLMSTGSVGRLHASVRIGWGPFHVGTGGRIARPIIRKLGRR
jgi:predicted DNA-binding transcriptional regulator AlpA